MNACDESHSWNRADKRGQRYCVRCDIYDREYWVSWTLDGHSYEAGPFYSWDDADEIYYKLPSDATEKTWHSKPNERLVKRV